MALILSKEPRMLLNDAKTRLALPWGDALASKLRSLVDGSLTDVSGQKMLILPYNQATFIAGQSIGLPIPAPIRHAYKWKGRYKPMAHQITTAAFFTRYRKCFCLNGLGTGKSLSALWAADYLIEQGAVNKVLILSPLSTLSPTWGSELFRHFPHHHYAVLHGKGKKLIEDLSARFLIANHELVRDRATIRRVIDREDINLVIVDECAMFRNGMTDKWKGLNALLQRKGRVWMMTGTPTPNAPTDAWAQIRLLFPDRVPRKFLDFKAQVMIQDGPYRFSAKPGAQEVIKHLLSPSIRFAASDCLDLPPLTYETRRSDMLKEQKELYKQMRKDALVVLEGKEVTAANEAIVAQKLLQIACGVVLHEGGAITIQTTKTAVLDEIIGQTEGKIIIFAPFTSVVKHIAERLKGRKSEETAPKVEVIIGETSLGERNRIINSFQDDPEGTRIIVANPRTMSHGLTLTAAATMIWFAPIWSNDTYEQAVKRIHRQGQTRHCTVIELESSPVEGVIYSRLRERQRVQGLLLDLLRHEK